MTQPLLGPAAPARLAGLRAVLAGAGFTEPAVCHRTGSDSIYDFRSIREGRATGVELTDRLDLLIRLFMDVELVEDQVLGRLLSADEIELLRALGLVASLASDPHRCHATVLLYPTRSLWIASDLNVDPEGRSDAGLSADAVYPAITKNTRHFLSMLPEVPCRRLLELCAGTGIAALSAARHAERTWAVDITERSTRFARFNAALNGIENCTVVQGDLYQPVEGRQFDRIVAHPPYMPSLEQKYVFRDGGEDGERITREIIGGLPAHLAPGGRCYCTCMLTDRAGAPAEARLRQMLGEHSGEFDLVVVSFQTFQPTEYYFQLALAGRATLEEVVRRHQIFSHLEVERLVYCSMVLERHGATRPGFTARRQAGPATGPGDIEWLLAWETAMAGPAGMPERLLAACPLAQPRVRLRLSQELIGGEWNADECVLHTAAPFALEARCPPWVTTTLEHADGRRTTRDHLRLLKDRRMVPEDAVEEEFAKLVRALAAGGFLQLPDYPLPPQDRA